MMKKSLYFSIAVDSVKKNRKLFIPFFFSGVMLVSITYILFFLYSVEPIRHMNGGTVLRFLLPIGIAVMSVFSLIFMFYCNSFLLRQRSRELGLYNILGMDKKNLSKILFWENIISFVISGFIGVFFGICLSKFAELGIVNLLKEEVSYDFGVDFVSAFKTLAIFAVIYICLLASDLKAVKSSSAIRLLKSANTAEKEPKANIFAAVAGVVILAGAYIIANSIENPLAAIAWFIVAVIMVIIATYLIFISLSVALCKFLRKRKKYYYKANHFVSVSTMTYRMKRNGAGLASICILITIVLVMLSCATCLYSSSETALNKTYPKDISFMSVLPSMDEFNEESFETIRQKLYEKIGECENATEMHSVSIAGLLKDGYLTCEPNENLYSNLSSLEQLCYVNVISVDEYNRLAQKSLSLGNSECFIFCTKTDITLSTFQIEHCEKLKCIGNVDSIELPVRLMKETVPIVTVIINDVHKYLLPISDLYNSCGLLVIEPMYCFEFDTSLSNDEQILLKDTLMSEMDEIIIRGVDGGYTYSLNSKAEARLTFYGLYGSLFFIGVVLSVVFVFATVLIMYYKQTAEGFEDRHRFEIMQKVGMTDKEIKKAINSQVLTVFFLPLILGGIHLAAAFPIIQKMLMLLMFENTPFMAVVTVITFAVFAFVYSIVYKLTSNTYYSIVKKS